MNIKYQKTLYYKFAFEFPFDQGVLVFCRSIRDKFGFREFTYTAGAWRFNNSSIMFLIKDKYPEVTIDPQIQIEIEKEERRITEGKIMDKKAIEIKEATTSSLVINGIKGELRDYQKIGVEFFLNNKGKGILGDSPGTGKSIQSLAYIVNSGHKRTLVVCPASVRSAWKEEIRKWTKLKSFIMDSQTNFSEVPHETQILVINYDILSKFKNELLMTKFDCAIIDEATYIKSNTSARSKVVKLLSKNIPSIIFLTGTPILNRPIELYNMLTMIDPQTWNDYYSFAGKYCGGRQGYFGYEAKGATNLGELQEKISKYFLRRTKDQVCKELPIKNFIDYHVDFDKDMKRNYYKASFDFLNYLKENKGKTSKEAEKSMRAEKLVKISLLREISAMGKLDAVKDLINSITEAGEKVLVFSSFNAPLLELQEEYLDSALILGSTPAEERGDIIKKFQTNPDCKVFFGGYNSAGIGITLTAASAIILINGPWTPAEREQAIGRADRIGSVAKNLNIYELYTEGTIDEFMKKLLDHKQKIFDQVIDGKEAVEEEGTIEDMIKMIEQQNTIEN